MSEPSSLRVQPFLPLLFSTPWVQVRDGDDTGRELFRRHYSYKPYRDGRDPMLFVGPGEKLVLLSPCGRAIFIWRRYIWRRAPQYEGINCYLFRNEGAGLSSALIAAADDIADKCWPGERHFTFVNPRKVRSANPGFCFLMAGWQRCGKTKVNGLLMLARPIEIAAQSEERTTSPNPGAAEG